MRKTVFARIFINNISIIVISFLVLTVSGGWILVNLIDDDRDNSVEESAHAIQGFLESGIPPKQVENFLYGISQSSNKSILLIDTEGNIVLASVNEQLYNKDMRVVPMKECTEVLKGNQVKAVGNLGGVYNKRMITYQFPYKKRNSETVLGAIIISLSASKVEEAKTKMFGTMIMTVGVVVALALLLSYALSRRISRPIREIGRSVKRFAKGDLSSRVELLEGEGNIVEIQDLANTFNDMAFHTEKAEEIRNSFISDVSHELRTPMTTIGGFVDGIMDGTVPPEKQNDYLAIVKDEVSRLSSLVNSFLDVTRAENAKSDPEIINFDINAVVRKTVANFEAEIVRKEIFVDLVFDTDPCFVKGDETLIRSVLNNLLENAIKFTDRNGKIKISAIIRQQEVVVSVYNTGCGIAEEDQPFVFERFYKADKSRSLNREGTGIGLCIVKDIIGRHGKNISVRSVEGEFAEFVFSLDKGKDAKTPRI